MLLFGRPYDVFTLQGKRERQQRWWGPLATAPLELEHRRLAGCVWKRVRGHAYGTRFEAERQEAEQARVVSEAVATGRTR